MPINADRNLRARNELIELLVGGRAFAVTGAGLSVWAGYPTWPEVISRLAAAVREGGPPELDVDAVLRNYPNHLHCAQQLGHYLGPPGFGEFIRREFGPLARELHDVLYRFVSLPFRHVLTFNFDESVERAQARMRVPFGSITWSNRRDMVSFLREMDASDFPRQVVHIHGKFSDSPEVIALTEGGYKELYRNLFFRNFLWLLATSQSLVFIGFGFKDSDFLHEFRMNVRDISDRDRPCHFAIVGLPPEKDDQAHRNELNKSYLIQPVFYTIRTNGNRKDHLEFVELLNGIADAVGRPVQPVIPWPNRVGADAPVPDANGIRQAERLADQFVERVDPGGGNVQG